MSRSRATAKKAGSGFERLTANTLRDGLEQPWIDRQVKVGSADVGDVGNVFLDAGNTQRLVVECKDWGGSIKAAEAVGEAIREKDNAGAAAAVAIVKRKGKTAGGEQWVVTTVDELVALVKTARGAAT